MSVVFAELFTSCFKELRDEEYCRGVVEAVAELAATRRVAYRRGRVGYVLYMPRDDQPQVLVAVDQKKRGLMLALAGAGYVVFLMYERGGDGKFRPVRAELMSTEIAAMANLKPPSDVL